jgi:hypothetical protein
MYSIVNSVLTAAFFQNDTLMYIVLHIRQTKVGKYRILQIGKFVPDLNVTPCKYSLWGKAYRAPRILILYLFMVHQTKMPVAESIKCRMMIMNSGWERNSNRPWVSIRKSYKNGK